MGHQSLLRATRFVTQRELQFRAFKDSCLVAPPCPRSSGRTALTPVPGTRQAGDFPEAAQ